MTAGGFAGEYHTQDVGGELEHTYRSLEEVHRRSDAVLCLDVIELLPLADGLAMLARAAGLLEPGGVLIVRTPNAPSLRDPMTWDISHVQFCN